MHSSSISASPEMPPLLDTLASDVENVLDHIMSIRYRLSEQVDRLLGPTSVPDTANAKEPSTKSLPTERIARVTGRLFTLAEELQLQINRLSRL